MDILGRKRPGEWIISSKSNSQWDTSGTVEDLAFLGGIHSDARKRIGLMELLLGKQPKDLVYSHVIY